MISLLGLSELAQRFAGDLSHPVEPLRVGDRELDVDAVPAVMGCVNLSRDSTYRESIATSTDAALRKGRVLAVQGADFVDIGAESSGPHAARVPVEGQISVLVPVVRGLAAEGIVVSVETYEPAVARACLDAGALILNYSGGVESDAAVFPVLAEYRATVILCYVEGRNVRDVSRAGVDADPIPRMLDHFAVRIESARAAGVDRIAIDPGIGFSLGTSVTPAERLDHQGRTLLNTFRLRKLGLPICHAMPHAFDLFGDQFRSAEGFFAVLAHLGGTGIYRTHEVPQVKAVLSALDVLGTVEGAPALPAGRPARLPT